MICDFGLALMAKARLAQGFAQGNPAGHGDIERTKTRLHRNGAGYIALIAHRFGNTGTFRAHDENIITLKLCLIK